MYEKHTKTRKKDEKGCGPERTLPRPPRKPLVCSAKGEPDGSPRLHETHENQRNARKGGQGRRKESLLFS